MSFFNWRAEENLVMNNKDNRVFMSRTIGLIVAPWKFDVLKTSRANICIRFKNITFPQGNYQPIVP